MSTISTQKTVREGSAPKRAAILAAARELFVRDGVERTSMDAVAARATVSKRTVYDYYGDKHRLLLGVVEAAGESVLASIREAIDAHLADDADIGDTDALGRALEDFAVQFALAVSATSDYAATFKLIAENGALLPELENHPLDAALDEAMTERISHFAARGLLDADDPQVATQHFNALTTTLAFFNHFPAQVDADRVRDVVVSGTRCFMRAYAPR